MSWCEANQVDYVLGFARNERLRRIIEPQMQQAAAAHQRTGRPARMFTEFAYQTNDTWSRPRRVVAKAEQIESKENPRYMVTSLEAANCLARKLYAELYCARGDMDNRIKEQLSLFAGRVSTATMRANPLRLYLSAAAYVLMSAFRRLTLSTSAWARAQCSTIRLQLPRIGAQVPHYGSQALDFDSQQLSAPALVRSCLSAAASLNPKQHGSLTTLNSTPGV